jgi:hypothetical protein
MKTLTITLKQHTPLIHFQHSEPGAKLRATEVKPKLDRYILTKLGGGNYETGINKAKEQGLLTGKGEHPALDYKLRISASGKDKIPTIKLEVKHRADGKYETEKFPLLLSNMGGRDSEDELVNFSMYKFITLKIITTKENVYKELYDYIPGFIANTNFGQRSNKGFGSFTPYKCEYKEDGVDVVESFETPYDECNENCPYMEFQIGNPRDGYQNLGSQIKLFTVIEKFWSDLRYKIKKDFDTDKSSIETPQSYIRAMKELSPEKNSTPNDEVTRMPAPIIFKPVWDDNGNKVRVYIMPDFALIKKLEEKYSTNNRLTSRYTINPSGILIFKYIKDFIASIIDEQYQNWSVKVGRDANTGKNVYIKVRFNNI